MKEVLFLEPAGLTRPYFANLYCECESSIYRRFGDDWRPIRRTVPRHAQEFDINEIISILQREVRQSQAIRLLVVAPTSSKKLASGVAKVAKDLASPVIALSLPFHHKKPFRDLGVSVPPVIVCDSASGTRALGVAAAEDFKQRYPTVKRPHVILIPGDEHRIDSRHRVLNFRNGLESTGFGPRYTRLSSCHWQRHIARAKLAELFAQNNRDRVDIVFAANDEMALGARDAILASRGSANGCLVYGFDGIDEVARLVESNDYNLRGTIKQDLEKMADALAGLIDESTKRPLGPDDNILIKPKPLIRPPLSPREAMLARWPDNVPKLNTTSGEWVTQDAVKKIDHVTEDTLKHHRKPAVGADRKEGGNLIRDARGRICRRDPVSRTFWYLLVTVNGLPAD